MKRQLDDYYDRFYNKLSEHFHILAADNFAKAKMMADWKANVRSRWDAIEIKSIEAGNGLNATVEAGKEYEVTVVVDEKGLDDAIGIESVIIRHEGGQDHIYEVIPLSSVSRMGIYIPLRRHPAFSTPEASSRPSVCIPRMLCYLTGKISVMYDGFNEQ